MDYEKLSVYQQYVGSLHHRLEMIGEKKDSSFYTYTSYCHLF
jgi:hypothetical protein